MSITVQMGPLSNMCGVDYWNASKDLPALLCIDAKGGIGPLLYNHKPELKVEEVLWDGDKVLVDRSHAQANDSLWTARVKRQLAERSLLELEHVRHGVTEFGDFHDGVLERNTESDQVYEALRHWSEACDRLDEANLVWDVNSGFGGVALFVSHYFEEEHLKALRKGLLMADSVSNRNHLASLAHVSCHVHIPLAVQSSYRACLTSPLVPRTQNSIYWGLYGDADVLKCTHSISDIVTSLPLEPTPMQGVVSHEAHWFGQSKHISQWLHRLCEKHLPRADAESVKQTILDMAEKYEQ